MIRTTATDFVVVVSQPTWISALRALSRHPDRVATGLVRRDPHRVPTGLVVQTLAVNERLGRGDAYAPLAPWIAVAMPTGSPPDTPVDWLQRLAPGYGQLLVVLLVGFGPDRAEWRGWAITGDVIRPLVDLEIVGPDMIRVTREDSLSEHDAAESRWSRTIQAVGEPAFSRLRAATVAVVGSSRTGNLAAGMLAALGVGRLTLLDGDLIETHNLDGMLLATPEEVGQNKAEVVARHLAARRPDLAIRASRRGLGGWHDEGLVGSADLIVTCVDRPGPRLRAARLARDRLIPHLDIGTGVTLTAGERQVAADVRLCLPRAGCVRCVGGVGDLAEAEYELRAPPGALPRRVPEPWNAGGRLGSLITLNAMAVSTGILSWLDLLAGALPASVWHRIHWVAGKTWEVASASVTFQPECPICTGTTTAKIQP